MRFKAQFCPKGHDKTIVGETRGACNKCNIKRADLWNRKNREIHRQHQRNTNWKYHGILNADKTQFTIVDYDRAYQIQQGKCAGCGLHQSELKHRLHTDHNHETGIFRFLLCMNCNRALGHAQDDPTILRRLADILEGK